MAWNWLRRAGAESPAAEPETILGLELNSGLARAATGRPGRYRSVPLEENRPELPLAIRLDGRYPEFGAAALAVARQMPHFLCRDYLPHLGQPWTFAVAGRNYDSARALGLFLERLRGLTREYDEIALVLPGTLTSPQVSKIHELARQARFTVRMTASTALAIASEMGPTLLSNQSPSRPAELDVPNGQWVVPLRRTPELIRQATALVVEADDANLRITKLYLDEEIARFQQAIDLPRLGVRLWKEKLLNTFADRCVRLCRRDPRDCPTADQGLFDQLDQALDAARHDQRAVLHVRSQHWYQDLSFSADELAAMTESLSRQTGQALRELTQNDPEPPAAIWVTHEAARLPGLATHLGEQSTARTQIALLAADAVPIAAVSLAMRARIGELPRVHLDSSIPLVPLPAVNNPTARPSSARSKG